METISGLFASIIVISVMSISSLFIFALMWMYAIYFLLLIGIFDSVKYFLYFDKSSLT